MEKRPHIVHKFFLGVGRAGVIGLGFVVELETDYMVVWLHFLHQPADDALGMF